MTLHVAVDMDDVVLDFYGSVCNAVNREFGTSFTKDEQTSWDDNPLKKSGLWKTAGYKSWWDWMRDREWLWAGFPAIDGSIGGIQTLRAMGCHVELVTSKPQWAEHNVWKWLGKWRPPLNAVTIVPVDQSKLLATEAQVIIDDKPSTCEEFARAGRQALLYQQPWNRNLPLPPRIQRVRDWSEVLMKVEGFLEFGLEDYTSHMKELEVVA